MGLMFGWWSRFTAKHCDKNLDIKNFYDLNEQENLHVFYVQS